LNPSSSQGGAAADVGPRDRQIAYFSFNFVLDMAAHGIPGLKPLECLLMMAINQANIAPLTRDPAARSRYGALEAPAPDEDRRPVSVRAVAASMRLPYETARRNIRRLEAKGVCVATEGGVLTPAAFMLTPAYFEAARAGHERLHALYRMLTARGLIEPLPGANYDESEPPVRGAVRLMSDYLLRTAETVMGRTGDLAATLVLLPLLAAAAGSDGRQPAPMSVAALARRTGLPAETVRRHAAALVEAGQVEAALCASGAKGLALADPSMTSPDWRSLLRENALSVQRMFAGLAERGVVAVWDQMAAQPGASSSG
jgi:DNA-binding IscR family transcriptional regulator